MKTDIILAGVGGQGILTIAAIIGTAALNDSFHLKQSEVHGMSQRGGDVQSHLRVSDKPIASDLIGLGSADLILSIEPMESLRYLPYLSNNGWLVTNITPFINVNNYPNTEKLIEEIKKQKNHILIDADNIATDTGSKRASNIVMLGAASPFIDMKFESFEKGIISIFERKGDDIVNINLKALKAGRKYTDSCM